MKCKEVFNAMFEGRTAGYKYTQGRTSLRKAFSDIDSDDVDWEQLCETAVKYNCFVFAFYFLRELLNRGLYKGEHAEWLYDNLDKFNQISYVSSNMVEPMFYCYDVDNLIVTIARTEADNTSVAFSLVLTKNTFLREILFQYFTDEGMMACDTAPRFTETFGVSLGKYESEMKSIEDFNGNTLHAQTDYYHALYGDDRKALALAIRSVIKFYKWLVSSNPSHSFFENDTNMSEALLFSPLFSNYLCDNYYFMNLDPVNIPYGKSKICFIIRNRENMSSRLTKDKPVTIDLSGLKCAFYRDLLLELIVISNKFSYFSSSFYGPIVSEMEKLYEAKQVDGYPNKRLDYINIAEAAIIRNDVLSWHHSTSSKGSFLCSIHCFLSYCAEIGKIEFEETALDYFSMHGVPQGDKAETIPSNDLAAINQLLIKKREESLLYQCMYTAFHMLLQTNMRISEICNLCIDSVVPRDGFQNQYEIRSISKTSRGRKVHHPITKLTFDLLKDLEEKTEQMRDECPVQSLKSHIFLYRGLEYKQVCVLTAQTFYRTIKKVCDDLGIKRYTASNLRDTHMTMSLEHLLRNGKSDTEMAILSGHKSIDTTNNHYISDRIDLEMEATHRVIIRGDVGVDIKGSVVDSIPDSLNNEAKDVEDGCGKCSSEECMMKGPLPCMICPYFITTPEHKVFFQKAIEGIDKMILESPNKHDKEDLTTIKTLYVKYLAAIEKHKEGVDDDAGYSCSGTEV